MRLDRTRASQQISSVARRFRCAHHTTGFVLALWFQDGITWGWQNAEPDLGRRALRISPSRLAPASGGCHFACLHCNTSALLPPDLLHAHGGRCGCHVSRASDRSRPGSLQRRTGGNLPEHNFQDQSRLAMVEHSGQAVAAIFFELIKSFLLPWRRRYV